MTPRAFQLHPADNVATLIDDAPAGPVTVIGAASGLVLTARESIARGHKIALSSIENGAGILKFGARIGHTTRRIEDGAWVHLHNLASDLDERSGSLDLQSGAPTDTNSAYV